MSFCDSLPVFFVFGLDTGIQAVILGNNNLDSDMTGC